MKDIFIISAEAEALRVSRLWKGTSRNSNSQLYKQAGNSISVNVPMEIYKILFKDYIKEE